MNVLVVSFDTSNFGGNDNWQISIAKKLANLGNNILLYTPIETTVNKEYEGDIEISNFDDREEVIEDAVLRTSYDLVLGLSQTTAPQVHKISKEIDKPSVIQILDIPWKLFKKNLYLNRDFLFWLKRFYYMRSADGILLMNPQTEKDFHKNFLDHFIDPGHQKMVKWGIDTDIADKVSEQEEKDQIAFVSRLVDYKGLDYGIKALSRLEESPKLVVVGDGEMRTEWEDLAEELDVDSDFKGALSDKEKFKEIKKSKYLIYPSTLENVAGGSIYEALYCKKPAICFDLSGLEDLIGSYADTVPKKDVNALSEKMKLLNSNKDYRQKRGEEGHKHVKNNLTQETHAQDINKFLEEIFSKGSRG